MAIEMTKKYRTREGHKVRLYAVDGCGALPVHGAILTENGWDMRFWPEDGVFPGGAPHDLIEIKPSAIDQMIASLQMHAMNARASNVPYTLKDLAGVFDGLADEAHRLKAEAEREG